MPGARRLVVCGSGSRRLRWVPFLVALGTLVGAFGTLVGALAIHDRPRPVVEVSAPAVAATPAPFARDQWARDEESARGAVARILVPTPTPVTVRALPTPTAVPREAWTREASFNFVAVGVDRRQDEEIPRTDTIMIGNVDLTNHRLTLVSVPRDLVVEIPGYGMDRINSAYVYGEQFEEQDGGIGLLRRTVERNFGIPVHHHGLIDFRCFRTTVDAVGGVSVDVPKEIVDTRYPTEDYGYKTVRFEAGRQRMDGERALEYARTRNVDNDISRIRRQQQIVSGLRQELLQLRTLPALPTILTGCSGLSSDLAFTDYLGLARAIQGFGDGDVALRAIDEQMVVDAHVGGAAVLLPRWDLIRALVRDSFPPSALAAVRSTGAN
jgi:LCP family protein required for cell wall assembly